MGARGKEQRKTLDAIPVCVHRGWKASYIFSPLWELLFCYKKYKYPPFFSCLSKFLTSALPLVLERDEGDLFSRT